MAEYFDGDPKEIKWWETLVTFFLIVGLFCAFLHLVKKANKEVEKAEKPIEVVVEVPKEEPMTFQKLEAIILALPEGTLKRNMVIILGAEYGDASVELNALLEQYAKMKMKQIENTH